MKNIPKIGIGVILFKNGRVLFGKRINSHGEGQWAFPGGHLEFGETPEDCAKRELLEETGLVALKMHAGPWVNNFHGNDMHYVTLFIVVTEYSGEPKVLEPHKCESWEWCDPKNLPGPLFSPVESLIANHGVNFLNL